MLSYSSDLVSYKCWLLSYSDELLAYSAFYLTRQTFHTFLIERKVHMNGKKSAYEWKAARRQRGLPSGRRFGRRPILANSGLSCLGGGYGVV